MVEQRRNGVMNPAPSLDSVLLFNMYCIRFRIKNSLNIVKVLIKRKGAG